MLRTRSIRLLVAALAVLAIAAPALAQKAKSVQNEAQWVAFDEAASTVTVKILNNGKGNKKLMKVHKKSVGKGKDVTFNVIPTGSVLKRTSVAINGVKGEITDISPGKRVLIYWVEDPSKKGELFARKIDVVLSEEELNRRYGTDEE